MLAERVEGHILPHPILCMTDGVLALHLTKILNEPEYSFSAIAEEGNYL